MSILARLLPVVLGYVYTIAKPSLSAVDGYPTSTIPVQCTRLETKLLFNGITDKYVFKPIYKKFVIAGDR